MQAEGLGVTHRKTRGGTYERVWKIVRRIPRGKVATYGQIARVAGFGTGARRVGYALHSLPPGFPVPWQRVINAKGMISFPVGSPSHFRQKQLLASEGILFKDGRIDLARFGWKRGSGSTRQR